MTGERGSAPKGGRHSTIFVNPRSTSHLSQVSEATGERGGGLVPEYTRFTQQESAQRRRRDMRGPPFVWVEIRLSRTQASGHVKPPNRKILPALIGSSPAVGAHSDAGGARSAAAPQHPCAACVNATLTGSLRGDDLPPPAIPASYPPRRPCRALRTVPDPLALYHNSCVYYIYIYIYTYDICIYDVHMYVYVI